MMIAFPHCKINLGLRVLDKRTDGYHNISSVFYPLKLNDALEIIIAGDNNFEFTLSGLDLVGSEEGNLCVKAYQLLQKEFDLAPVKMHLHKRIPAGAGLGGGSADAAFTLRMINDLFKLGLTNRELLEFALQLGSDCAFFIEDGPKQVSGRGDILDETSLSLKGYQLVLVYPEIHVSTTEAYSNIEHHNWIHSIQEIISTPVNEWKHSLKNDFEPYVFKTYPLAGEIKNMMYENGALFSSLSGSGSTVYGIFEKNTNFRCKFHNFFVWKEEL